MAGVGAGGPSGRAGGYGAGGVPGSRFLAGRESALRLGIPGGTGEFGVGRGGLGGGGGGGNFLNRHPKFPPEDYPPGHLLADEYIDTTDAPVEYLCPISTTLMADPVIAADGFSYERANIEGWIRSMKRNGSFVLPRVIFHPHSPLSTLSRVRCCFLVSDAMLLHLHFLTHSPSLSTINHLSIDSYPSPILTSILNLSNSHTNFMQVYSFAVLPPTSLWNT